MPPHVPFRGFQAANPNSWTYFDSFWLHPFKELALFGDHRDSNLEGQVQRRDPRGKVPDLLNADVVGVLEGISDRSRIVMDLKAKFVKVWVRRSRTRARSPAKLLDTQRRLTIAFSYHQNNKFYKASLDTLPAVAPQKLPSDIYFATVWQWEIRHLDSDMQRFIEAFALFEGIQVTIAVTGETTELKERPLVNGWPTIGSIDRTLESMALVVASPSSAFIKLLASSSDEDAKSVKIHRELLEKASPYFHALLSGGFAETSILAVSGLEAAKVTETSKAKTPDFNAKPVTRAKKRQKRSLSSNRRDAGCTEFSKEQETRPALSPALETARDLLKRDGSSRTGKQSSNGEGNDDCIPVIEMPDTSFEELQVLTYYIYTGIAVFRQRSDASKAVRELPKSDPPWKKGTFPAVNAVDMYRVADRYDFEALRTAALGHIGSEISVEHLAEDLKTCEALHIFSPLKRLYLEFCMRHQNALKATSNYDDIMDYFVTAP